MVDTTFRLMPNYADGTPGASDRFLFETSVNLPRGCAPATLKSTLGLTIADISGLQTALDAKAPVTSPTFTGTVALGGTLDGNSNSIVDYVQPHVAGISGVLTQDAHGGRVVLATGTITSPVTNGFICLIRNKSGSPRLVQPASGVLIHEGTTKASISLPHNRSLLVHGDGTDVWAEGAIV